MATNFDPNQPRGHASNPGRWAAYQHSAPEADLTIDPFDDGQAVVPRHVNDIGDYCPHSGAVTKGGECPIFCRDSRDGECARCGDTLDDSGSGQYCDDCAGEFCECGEPLDDGEGSNGKCGTCADRIACPECFEEKDDEDDQLCRDCTLEAEREAAAAGPEASSGGYGIYPATVSDVKVGDLLWDKDESEVLGRAVDVNSTDDGSIRVRLATGGAITGTPESELVIARTETPPPYEADGEYWEQVSNLYHPNQPASVLEQVTVEQAEDDFMYAVASHPNATATALDAAANHSSLAVRHKVLEHPAATAGTVERIRDEAAKEAEDAAASPEAWGPMRGYYEAQAVQAEALRVAADRALHDRVSSPA